MALFSPLLKLIIVCQILYCCGQHSSTLNFGRSNGVCQFHGSNSNGKFVRLKEDVPVGAEIFRVVAFPRQQFNIQALDGSRADGYFTFRELDRRRVAILLNKSLQDLVDQSKPKSSLKFRLSCLGRQGNAAYLPVMVYISDVNDHRPEFMNAPYNVTIDEHTPLGLTVFRGISSLDKDQPNGPNSEIEYEIVGGNEEKKFSLESRSKTSSVLVLRKQLDYENGDTQFNLTIKAQDKGSPPLASFTTLSVKVRDSDDRNPVFSQEKYFTKIREDFPITGQSIQKQLVFQPPIFAYDQDQGIKSDLLYSIKSGNEDGYFSIDPATGLLYRIKEIDFESLQFKEEKKSFKLVLEAIQKDNPLKSAQAQAVIQVEDMNDNFPEFSLENYNITLVENLPKGFQIMKFTAIDKDHGQNSEFDYVLSDPTDTFDLDPRSGVLTLKTAANLDREVRDEILLQISTREKVSNVWNSHSNAEESTSESIFGAKTVKKFSDLVSSRRDKVWVKINIADENDNAPKFSPSGKYTFKVSKSSPSHTVIGKILAQDPDFGKNGLVRYRVNSGSGSGYFGIDAVTGEIRTRTEMSNLDRNRYELTISATDQPDKILERKSSLAQIEIILTNTRTNDNIVVKKNVPKRSTPSPAAAHLDITFPPDVQVFNVSRQGRKGQTIGQIIVNNPRKVPLKWTMRHRYRFGVPFGIDRKSGKIGLVKDIGKYALSQYTLKVQVEHKDVFVITEIRINLTDPSDAQAKKSPPPKNLSQKSPNKVSEFRFTVKENLKGALVANLTAVDSKIKDDQNDIQSQLLNEFFLMEPEQAKEKFSISDSGLLYTKVALDREEESLHEFFIVNGRGILRGKRIFKILVKVEDENDNSPAFGRHIHQGSIARTAKPNTEVNLGEVIKVTDPDLNDKVELKLLGKSSSVFKLEQKTGKVYLESNASLDQLYSISATGEKIPVEKIYLRIRATDMAGHITESQLVIHLLEERIDKAPEIRGLAIINSAYVTLQEKNELIVKESAPPLTHLARLMATDETSSPDNFQLTFKINSEFVEHLSNPKRQIKRHRTQPDTNHFQMEEKTGDLVLALPLKPNLRYKLNVSVEDENGMVSSTDITVSVVDVNDHSPVFDSDIYAFQMEPGLYENQPLATLSARDEDYGDNGLVTYSIEAQDIPFKIDPINGLLLADGHVDKPFKFRVKAEDSGTDIRKHSYSNISITVLESSNKPKRESSIPSFFGYKRLRKASKLQLEKLGLHEYKDIENLPVFEANFFTYNPDETFVVQTSDSDKMNFELVNQKDVFAIDKGGILRLRNNLKGSDENINKRFDIFVKVSRQDDEKISNIALVIANLSGPRRTSTTSISPTTSTTTTTTTTTTSSSSPTTSSMTSNESQTIFLRKAHSVKIKENIPAPVKILDINDFVAENALQNKFKFDLVGKSAASFRIEPRSGYLMMLRSPDREQQDQYVFRIRAYKQKVNRGVPILYYTLRLNDDEEDNSSRVIAEMEIDVQIEDENDNKPEFLNQNDPKVVSVSPDIIIGSMITKVEAWDSDIGPHADIRYSLSQNSNYFAINQRTGDLSVRKKLSFQGGRTFQLKVVAKDLHGSTKGLSNSITVMIHVIDANHQIKMVLNNDFSNVMKDMTNISRSLSSISGFDVHPHRIENHNLILKSTGNLGDSMTDLYLYALDSNELVKTDRIIRSLSHRLGSTKSALSPHELVEIQAGSLVLLPDEKEQNRQIITNLGGLEAWQIVTLIIAGIVFLGTVIALAAVCSAKFRRIPLKYPAPLAIPLPGNPLAAPIPSQPTHLTLATPVSILHHGDPRRHSTKSYNSVKSHKTHHSSSRRLESSEDTSDTCVDDQMEARSNPRSHSRDSLQNRRLWSQRSNASSVKYRTSKNLNNLDDDPDQGSSEHDGCHHSINSSCDSCADCHLESRYHTYSHFAQHPSHLAHRKLHSSHSHSNNVSSAISRRHKSASPHRRSTQFLNHEESMLPNIGTPSRSRSVGNRDECRHCQHCCCKNATNNEETNWSLLRNRPLSKSARSTRWEVYHDWGFNKAHLKHSRKSKSYDKNLETENEDDDDDDDDENDIQTRQQLRIASSNANSKSHSWRGDHPMMKQKQQSQQQYFEHEPKRNFQANKDINMPFRTTYTYGEETYSQTNKKLNNNSNSGVNNGIKLVGLVHEK